VSVGQIVPMHLLQVAITTSQLLLLSVFVLFAFFLELLHTAQGPLIIRVLWITGIGFYRPDVSSCCQIESIKALKET